MSLMCAGAILTDSDSRKSHTHNISQKNTCLTTLAIDFFLLYTHLLTYKKKYQKRLEMYESDADRERNSFDLYDERMLNVILFSSYKSS